MFGGGYAPSTKGYSTVVDAYDENLTRTTPAALSQGRYSLAATMGGNYALFGGGGLSGGYSTVIDAYDENLTRTTPTPLSQSRSGLAATTVGNYALFGGGSEGSVYYAVVDAYLGGPRAEILIPQLYAYKFQEHTEEQLTYKDIVYSKNGTISGYMRPAYKEFTGFVPELRTKT